jgi:predicted hydrocarbon binding protein
MSFSIERLAESIERNLPAKDARTLLQKQPMKWRSEAPGKRAEQVRAIMTELEAQCGRRVAGWVMEACGVGCLGSSVIQKAKQLHKESSDISDFLMRMNEHHIGGSHLTYENGVVQVVYKKCYCGTVSHTDEPISLTYCNCSKGWVKELFQRIYGRSVRVEIVDTIMHGADQCTFKVFVKDKEAPSTNKVGK